MLLRYLHKKVSREEFLNVTEDAPPKLPDTTNLVLTNNKKDHSEIRAMNTRTKLENKIPPL